MHKIDLKGVWRLKRRGNRKEYPATVHGCIHTDLIAAGVIPDPFISTNELDVQWVSDTDWTYSRTFDVRGLSPGQSVFLICEGLDIVAEIRLNGKLAGRSENMFLRHSFDIGRIVENGRNRIEVMFFAVQGRRDKEPRNPIRGRGFGIPLAARTGQDHPPQPAAEGAVPVRLGLGAVPADFRNLAGNLRHISATCLHGICYDGSGTLRKKSLHVY